MNKTHQIYKLIVDDEYEYQYHSKEKLRKGIDKRRGHKLDVTVWHGSYDDRVFDGDYAGTLDVETLKDKGY